MVDVSGNVPVLLRPGTITLPELERVVGEVRLVAHVREASRAVTGMLDRHYAPRARLDTGCVDRHRRSDRDAGAAA